MSALVSLDPGIRGCGVAAFLDGTLRRAAYVRNPITKGGDAAAVTAMAITIHRWTYMVLGPYIMPIVAVEVPRVYPAARQKGDQNDLITVAGVAFAVAALHHKGFAPAVTYYPREWKGTVDADGVMVPRIKNRLTVEEKKVLEPCAKSVEHNVWDAIGIGLKALGRLDPKRVIARTK